MKKNEVQRLLDENGIMYHVSRVINRREFYQEKGFSKIKGENSFWLITIPNPNHNKDIELTFKSDEKDSEFVDLEFGGHWYQLFECEPEDISAQLIKEIKDIIEGKVYIVFAQDAKTGGWFFSGCFYDSDIEAENDMEEFHKLLAKIRAPKSWLRKFLKRADKYEIFNWNKYECIIK